MSRPDGAIEGAVARDGGGEDSHLGVGEAARQLGHPDLDAAASGGEVPGEEEDLHGGEKLTPNRLADPSPKARA